MDIPKKLEPDKLRCPMCDFFGFERRAYGAWAFCYWKSQHFPDDILPGDHVCLDLTINGRKVLK